MKDVDEKSYLDLLNDLHDSIKSDETMPDVIKKRANDSLQKLFEILSSYSA